MTLESLLVKQEFQEPKAIQAQEFVPLYIGDFIENYFSGGIDLRAGGKFQFDLNRQGTRKKINPILQLAKPEEAEVITGLFKEAYDGTYPYKEFEDVEEMRKMLEEGLVNFILFKDKSGEILGCLKFVIDPVNRRGYQGGMALKKKYLGRIDVVRAYIGACVYFYQKYRNDIFLWYGEARTAHSKVQYFTKICAVLPLAFFPNKDIFLNKVESDLFVIAYQEKTLREYRCKEIPTIIPEVVDCFIYSSERYELGPVNIQVPEINLDRDEIMNLQQRLKLTVEKDKYNYNYITLSFEGSDSHFKFLYTPQIQNFEKVQYEIKSLEELFVYIQEFQRLAQLLNIRYTEIFVSAHEPGHQKIFNESGLIPRGYVPCWKYDEASNTFEDHVVFNQYTGDIDPDIQLIPEGWKLLESLNLIIR